MSRNTSVNAHKIMMLTNVGRWFVHWWNFLINIGISGDLAMWNRKRIRLLNGICIMGFMAHSCFVISNTEPEFIVVYWESFQSAIFYLCILLLNKHKKYYLSCHLFCIYNVFCYSYFAITHGKVDAAEYLLLPSGMAAAVLFKETRVVFLYLFLNFVFFWICRYSFTVMKPIFVLPSDIYVANHVVLFIVSFIIVIYFKLENNRQEVLVNNQKKKLVEEKSKVDKLLLNILPNETAEELKATGFTKPRYFEEVTVMFTDFHNFTQMAVQMPPEILVEEIHMCFSSFDSIMNRYGIEKIKTIGDSYMCASGLPTTKPNHAEVAVCAAVEILTFIETRKREKQLAAKPYFEIRIGIHTGSVIAGVVGTKKFAYDIWGNTVNMASRLESCGEEGKINISRTTYELVKEKFNCTYRGQIDAKHIGMVDMYFVETNSMLQSLSGSEKNKLPDNSFLKSLG